ncbi:hypothetical protein ACI2L4_16080 [Streptomyces sparsogenes]|uniref:hypothetical protein n=1 Tax=Streptomyces sparsogenes TaxID=67365 RepID=UPI00384F33C9
MNPVDPLAVDRFVEAGYQPFADALGDFFGSPVAYMFFDQPHAVYYDWAERTGDLRAAMPFHESLAASIRERWHERTFGLDHFGVDGYRDLTAVDAQDALVQLSPCSATPSPATTAAPGRWSSSTSSPRPKAERRGPGTGG